MIIKNVLVLIGPPGSGKGTQGKMLAAKLNYNYLSMGQAIREYTKTKTERAQEIKKIIDGGHFIPNEWIRELFFEKIKALPKAAGLILDGFPRDFHQSPILDEMIEKYHVDGVRAIFIDVPKIKIIERLKIRETTEARADDDPNVIETRFHEYDEKTFPLVSYFEHKHKLISINGDQSVEKVQEEILRKLSYAQPGI